MPVYFLSPHHLDFPDPRLAPRDGLMAIGGDLSLPRLLLAYHLGIFPWYSPGEEILWWSPDPRYVLYPDQCHISKSMRALLRKSPWQVTLDTAFEQVMRACSTSSLGRQESGTWISEDIIEAYLGLHNLGYAHSVEVWDGEQLIGGLYGVSLGRIFFGESMFTHRPNASKYGFITLVNLLKEKDFQLIDCQTPTDHLISLGAEAMPRNTFLDILQQQDLAVTHRGKWTTWLQCS